MPEDNNTADKLDKLKSQRSSVKGNITRIKSYINSNQDTLTATDLECRLGILESYWRLLLSHQSGIEQLAPTDQTNDNVRGELEDLYCGVKSKILSLLPNQKRLSILDETSNASYAQLITPKPNLPKMKLPTFSGKYSEYPSFIAKFNELVGGQDISTTEKYTHLLNCLSGPALRTIDALGQHISNYDKALETLKNRYDNNTIIFQEHIADIFNLPNIARNSAEQLRSLLDNVNAHLNALHSLGSDKDILEAIVVYLVNTKLDIDTQKKWDESLSFSKLPTWNDLAQTLTKRCMFLETRDSKLYKQNENPWGNNKSRNMFKSKPNNGTALTASNPLNSGCKFCSDQSHKISSCKKFAELAVQDRFAHVKKINLCINCLREGHTLKQCKSTKCRVCSGRHNTLLHRYQNNARPNEQSTLKVANISENNSPPQSQYIQSNLHVSSQNFQQDYVFLATAIVKIKDNAGSFHMARTLLDSGSQLNFITDRLVQNLKLRKHPITGSVQGIGSSSSMAKYETRAVINSRFNDYSTCLEMWVLPSITGKQPSTDIDINQLMIPDNIELADPLFYKAQKIDLLIGANTFFELLSVGQIKLENNPTLQKTLLGWIVAGRYNASALVNHDCNIAVESKCSYDVDQHLCKLVEQFWNIENVETTVSKLTEEEQKCEEIFEKNISRLKNGSIMVKLPFKKPPELLGKSFEIAKRRFMLLEKRLDRNPANKLLYSTFLKEYLSLGHMEPASFNEIPVCHFFMPHQFVLRPESSSTPLRVVFDASCRTSSNLSLNDVLAVGPTVQNDLYSILLKFRCYKYALTADISKMYRQVYVTPDDRHFQYILWREDKAEDLQVFRLKTVTYGTASAPYLATKCLNYLAKEATIKYPEAADIIQNSFYVDDLICGANDTKKLFQIKNEVTEILDAANMKLCKWYSNNLTLLDGIPPEYRERPLRINDSDVLKTLGMVWDPNEDTFNFDYKSSNVNKSSITKRIVLADLARLFDPLGLINPIIVTGKIFLQELWLLKLAWDESLPIELHHRWLNFKENLNALNKIKVPRYILSDNAITCFEIHGFSDASIRAYGCCLYLRCTDSCGNVKVSLISSKSKVAPSKKKRTLPVLELFGAVLLAKLWDKIKPVVTQFTNAVFFWSDSNIVLGWLAAHASKWQTLISNRVSLIQELTEGSTWKYVDTKNNPADIISRGVTVKDLEISVWFTGPQFLYLSSENWPAQKQKITQNLPKERKSYIKLKQTSLVTSTDCSLLLYLYNCSNFSRIRRIMAYILRFVGNIRLRMQKKARRFGMLSAEDLESAMLKIVQIIQTHEFEAEIAQLKNDNQFSYNCSIRCLNPFLDPNTNLLRVGGRLLNSNLPYDVKCPILLPKNNNFVKIYIRYMHFRYCHAGTLTLMSIIRQKFWVVNLRDYSRKIVRSCLHCYRYRPVLLQQIMGNLPKDRVNCALAFSISGVNFCGPFMISSGVRGKGYIKAYIAIFVCFISKGVHIEVVSNLTSEAFIAALKRFISRRTLCKKLYCDNATNFVGARNSLAELKQRFLNEDVQNNIRKWCAESFIEFNHIPPRSPHFGGIWEAAVKSTKRLLYPTIQQAHLTFEELTTLCAQIESILNSRPITEMSNDPSDEAALTPAHFWGQAPLETILESNQTNIKSSYVTKWQRISTLQQYFWQRWYKEYVISLQKRYKWQTSSANAIVGTLVLVHEENIPPQKWLLGRIVSISKSSSDNKVRVVEVKTKAGIITRAIHKLARLPLEDEIDSHL